MRRRPWSTGYVGAQPSPAIRSYPLVRGITSHTTQSAEPITLCNREPLTRPTRPTRPGPLIED